MHTHRVTGETDRSLLFDQPPMLDSCREARKIFSLLEKHHKALMINASSHVSTVFSSYNQKEKEFKNPPYGYQDVSTVAGIL